MSNKILQAPPVSNMEPVKTLGQFFFEKIKFHGGLTAQIDATPGEEKHETFASLKRRTVRVALGLQKRGVTSKDVIAFCSTNTLDNVVPVIAASYLGATGVSFDPSQSPRHTKHQIDLVAPRVIFVEESSIKLFEESLADVKSQPELIIVLGKSQKYLQLDDLLQPEENEDEFRPVVVDVEDVAMMIFSSGTTGSPKAICHTHRNLAGMIPIIIDEKFTSRSIFTIFTLYSLSCLWALLWTVQLGIIRIVNRKILGAQDIYKMIEHYKIEALGLPPTMLYALTKCPEAQNYDTSSVIKIMTGGTALNPEQYPKLESCFKNVTTLLAYGMTETSLVSFLSPNHCNGRIASVGKIVPGVTLKVVDLETGKPLGSNQKGEICVKTSTMLKCYLGVDQSETFDHEGFFKTGDVGYFDDEEYIFIVDRIKEVFKYQSRRIEPSAIENILYEHPAVVEAVVFGVPVGEEGEVPTACVTVHKSVETGSEELDEFVAQRVTDRERLRGGIFIVDKMPKTASGKLLKRVVRESIIKLKSNQV